MGWIISFYQGGKILGTLSLSLATSADVVRDRAIDTLYTLNATNTANEAVVSLGTCEHGRYIFNTPGAFTA